MCKKLLKISSKLEHERKNLGGLKIQLGKIKKEIKNSAPKIIKNQTTKKNAICKKCKV